MEKISVSFPGLGIDTFELNKVAFTLFGKIEVRWYGIIITCGILLAFLYAMYRGKKNEGVISDDVLDIGMLTVFFGILGARLYYVLTTLDVYNYDSFYDVIAIWDGGIGIYGGIIGGCIGILIGCAWKKISWRRFFDMTAPGVILAQAIGRWGNFFNGEAYGSFIGSETTIELLTKEIVLPSGEGTLFHTLRMGLSPNMYSYFIPLYFHPTFLYESIWNLMGFLMLHIFYKHKKFDGQVALLFFSWYGLGRFFIEGFRTDSLFIPGTELRISQCLGLFAFVAGILLMFLGLSVAKKKNELLPCISDGAAVAQDSLDADETAEENEVASEEAKRAEDAKSMEKLDLALNRWVDKMSEKLAANKKEAPADEGESPVEEQQPTTSEAQAQEDSRENH